MYDVIVVGSGPSGSMSAYHIAAKGFKVLLLEKAALPRVKTCGGGLTYKAIDQIPFDVSSVVETATMGGIVEYKGRPLVKVTAPGVAYQIRRQPFDNFLAQKAASNGTTILDKTTVTGLEFSSDEVVVTTTKGTFSSRFLIGADGVNSQVAHKSGLLLDREVGIAIEGEVGVPAAMADPGGSFATFDFGAISHGYGWIFPKNEILSIGVFHAAPTKYPQLRDDFNHYLSLHPEIEPQTVTNIRAHPIPLGGQKSPRHAGRVLLVGDAANLADPWMGEGINYAIYSAQIASDVIIKCLNSENDNLEEYSRRINQTLVRQFAYARFFASIVYHFPRFTSKLLSKSPTMQEFVFGNLQGKYTFEQLSRRLILNMPRILLQTIR